MIMIPDTGKRESTNPGESSSSTYYTLPLSKLTDRVTDSDEGPVEAGRSGSARSVLELDCALVLEREGGSWLSCARQAILRSFFLPFCGLLACV